MPAIVLGFVLLMPGAIRAQAPDSGAIAFVDVSVIPMDRERVLAHQTVVVRDRHIIAVGSVGDIAVPAGAVQIDGRGRFLIPGLADMHVHFRDELKDSTHLADLLFTMLANGITTVRDMHSGRPGGANGLWGPRLRDRLARGELLGPRLYLAGDPDDSSPAAAARSVEAMKKSGYDFVKVYEYGHPIYDSIKAAAARVGLPLVGHPPQDPPDGFERLVVQDRWASIEHLARHINYLIDLPGSEVMYAYFDSTKRATAAWRQPDYQIDRAKLNRIVTAIKRAGVWECPTLITLDKQKDVVGRELLHDQAFAQRYFELDLEILRALHRAGVPMLLGTDSPGLPSLVPGFAAHQELDRLVRLGGLTPYEALATSTKNVSQFLGAADSTGTVAVGKRADLVLLTANPLHDIHNMTAIAGVMIGGHWLPRLQLDERLDHVKPVQSGDDRYGTYDVQVLLARQLLWR